MTILLRTDNHVHGGARLTQFVESIVEGAVSHVRKQVTRVDVYVRDENGPKSGEQDFRCSMEARLGGMKPFAVTHHAGNMDEAIRGRPIDCRTSSTTPWTG